MRTFKVDRHCLVILLSNALITFIGTPVRAQRGGAPAPAPPPQNISRPSDVPSGFDQEKIVFDSMGNPISPKTGQMGNCFLPPLNGLPAATASTADLKIPAKSLKEFEDGCMAVRSKKMPEAENHLRKAVKEYPKYPAAWVVLGQVLEAEQKGKDARDACSQPMTANPNYIPAYLCLADISAREKNWDDVLKLSTHALELDPATDAAAYSYSAAANLNLNHLPDAEKSALKAVEIDKANTDPRVHFLLAQIYAAKGDGVSEETQLREYLKFATDPADIAMVKNYIEQLDKQLGK